MNDIFENWTKNFNKVSSMVGSDMEAYIQLARFDNGLFEDYFDEF